MGDTAIEWTDKVWNPVSGCSPVSPGCDHCYARRMAQRLRGRFGYPQEEPFAVTLHPEKLEEPLHWRKPQHVFVCSMSDLFHPRVPWRYIVDVFKVMAATPQHTYQVLTKRPGRMAWFAQNITTGSPCGPPTGDSAWPSNVWAGVSVESAKYLPRLDVLARLKRLNPNIITFVSLEPLLGPVDLRPWLDMKCGFCGESTKVCGCSLTEIADDKGYLRHLSDEEYFDDESPAHLEAYNLFCKEEGVDVRPLSWVILGGESGPGARPMHPQWVRDVRDQCQEAGVPFFHKQNGEWSVFEPYPGGDLGGAMRSGRVQHVQGDGREIDGHFRRGDLYMLRVGRKAAGSLLDGRGHKEFPVA